MSLSPKINSELIKKEGRIVYRNFQGNDLDHFQVRIFVDMDPGFLEKIEKVEYILHSSFRDNHRVATDPKNQFQIIIWTWGQFEIAVGIHYKTGESEFVTYYLDYDLPADSGKEYFELI